MKMGILVGESPEEMIALYEKYRDLIAKLREHKISHRLPEVEIPDTDFIYAIGLATLRKHNKAKYPINQTSQ